MKTIKSVKAWAVLDGKKILFVGGCEGGGSFSLNHLEIFPLKRDAIAVAEDPDLGINLETIPVLITPLPKKKNKSN